MRIACKRTQNMRLTVTNNCSACALEAASVRAGMMCPLLPRLAQAGEVIHREADPAGFAWFIVDGAVSLSRQADGAAPARVRAAGSFIGLETLVAEAYLDTARAETAATLCGAPREAMLSWMGLRQPDAAGLALEAALRDACADAGVTPCRACGPHAADPPSR